MVIDWTLMPSTVQVSVHNTIVMIKLACVAVQLRYQ